MMSCLPRPDATGDGESNDDDEFEEEDEEITTLEEEVALIEATLSTLKSKLENIDESINNERVTLAERNSKLQILRDREAHLKKTFVDQETFVKKVELGFKKCTEELKKKLEAVYGKTTRHHHHPRQIVPPTTNNNNNSTTTTEMITTTNDVVYLTSSATTVVVSTTPPLLSSSLSSSSPAELLCSNSSVGKEEDAGDDDDDDSASVVKLKQLGNEEEEEDQTITTVNNNSISAASTRDLASIINSSCTKNSVVEEETNDESSSVKGTSVLEETSILCSNGGPSSCNNDVVIKVSPDFLLFQNNSIEHPDDVTVTRAVPRLSFLKRCYYPGGSCCSLFTTNNNKTFSFELLQRMLLVQHEELSLAAAAVEKGQAAAAAAAANVHFGVLMEESLIGSCLDPHALVYRWAGGETRMILPWEDTTTASTTEENETEKKTNDEIAADVTIDVSDGDDDLKCSSSLDNTKRDFEEEELEKEEDNNGTFELIHYGEQTASSTLSNDEGGSSSLLSSSRKSYDPNSTLCPYELNGVCRDVNCLFEHLAPRPEAAAAAAAESAKESSNDNDTTTTMRTTTTTGKVVVNNGVRKINMLPKLHLPDICHFEENKNGEVVKKKRLLLGSNKESQKRKREQHNDVVVGGDVVTKKKAKSIIDVVKQQFEESCRRANNKQLDSIKNDDNIKPNNNNDGEEEEENEWDGKEQDFIPLPSIADLSSSSSPASSSDVEEKTIKSPSSLRWWSTTTTSAAMSSSDQACSSSSLSLSHYLNHNFGFHLQHNRASSSLPDDDSGIEIMTSVSTAEPSSYYFTTAKCLDASRFLFFAGRWNIAFALISFAKKNCCSSTKNKKNIVLVFILEGAEQILKKMMNSSAVELFEGNVGLSLLAECLFEYYLNNNDSTTGKEEEEDEDNNWMAMIKKILHPEVDKDGTLSRNIYSISEKDDCVHEVDTLQRELRNALQSIDSSSSTPSSSANNNNNTHAIKKIMKLYKYSIVGKQLARFLMRLLKKGGKRRHLPVVHFLESIWVIVKHHSDALPSYIASCCTTFIIGYSIFSSLSETSVLSSTTENNTTDLFILDTPTHSSLVLLEQILRKILMTLQYPLTTTSTTPTSNYSDTIKNPWQPILLSPLLSAWIALTVQLGKYSQAQSRLEKLLCFSKGNNNLIIYSELLWSQLLVLRSCFVGPKKNMLALVDVIKKLEPYPRHFTLLGDFGWRELYEVISEEDGNERENNPEEKKQHSSFDEAKYMIRRSSFPRYERSKLRCQKMLPIAIMLFNGLTKLHVSNCGLKIIHLSFGNCLTNLKELDVSSNNLTSLPDSLTYLNQLENLNISSNLISYLPPTIGKLASLTQLHASNNKLEELPLTLCDCRNLRVLDVSKNDIRTFPRDLALKLDCLIDFRV